MIGRVTITLPQRILAKLDEEVRLGRRPNRSSAIASALEDYYARRAGDTLREATIAYYQSLSDDERTEATDFARASRDSLAASLGATPDIPQSRRRKVR